MSEKTHWDGCATVHTKCAIVLLRDMLAALLKEDSPLNRANAEKILAATKGWEPQEPAQQIRRRQA